MIDIKLVRENPKLFEKSYVRMKKPDVLEKFHALQKKDEQLRALKKELDDLRASRNVLSQKINTLKKEGKSIDVVLKDVKELPEKIKKAEEDYASLDVAVKDILSTLPNLLHDAVPYGKSAEENVEIRKSGRKPKFSFPIKNHVEILEALNAVDFDASARSTGNGFYYLKGDFALLNQALIQFAIHHMRKKGYMYVEPPLMLRPEILFAAIDKEAFEQSVYKVEGEDACLIGTSEFSLLGMHKEEILTGLPKKYFSYSMCFRKEIGSHGINEKGLWRTHQFNKVEQFVFCRKEDSWKHYEEMLRNTEEIFKALELPYRVIEICTGDLARWKARSADVEVWRPTTNSYGEVASLSNCTDYQARNLNIRYEENGERHVVHTLNNTVVATSRALVAIVEHYQQKDGTIRIPKVLSKYMGGKKIIKKQ